MEPVDRFNSLAPEIIQKIFSNLTQNELSRISRVCKKWNEYTKSPVLWTEVDVHFFCHGRGMNENVSTFVGNLPFNVTHLKLDFIKSTERLKFEEFSMRLNEKCPNLNKLVLHDATLSIDLPSVVNLCGKFLPNLTVLILPHSIFNNCVKGSEHDGSSKIEILDISSCYRVRKSDIQKCFSTMTCLKKLNLCDIAVDNKYEWLPYANDVSFLQRLDFLNLGLTFIGSRSFQVLRIHARNLTELFLCGAYLHEDDFIFNDAFLLLKSICLRRCTTISCLGIKYLLQSCQSVENVYVDKNLAEAWTNHPFNTGNILGIVNTIEDCDHNEKLQCFHFLRLCNHALFKLQDAY